MNTSLDVHAIHDKRWALHTCLVCLKPTSKVHEHRSGAGDEIITKCSSCGAIGKISNMEPWYGYELPLERLKAMFTLAGIEILDEPLKLQNHYWQGNSKEYYHPWWFVKVSCGWIEIGYRKRVMSIDWKHTTVRAIVTTDELTKGDDHVHAYSEEKAIEYLKMLKAHFPVARSMTANDR